MATEREAIERLYLEIGPMVYRRCLKLLGDREFARDATHEVFIKLLRSRSSDALGAAPSLPWIFAVATHYCLNLRRDALRQGRKLKALELTEAVQVGHMPTHQLSQELLERFDPKTQSIAVGVLVDEMEHKEVADLLKISSKTVARKLERFLARARIFLTRSEP